MVPESKARWARENTTMLAVKLMNKTDGDIISFLESLEHGSKQSTVKQAIREYMERHG